MLATLSPETQSLLKSLNITEGEYQKICNHLHREPNANEIAMFSVLWSEHCCYKNSRHLLRLLPNKGPRVVAGPGENAGIIDIGDGIQIAFKIESHNHPTAVEPFQGAATGVGGILRDIFTMNARPIANLNSLRFGPLSFIDRNDTDPTKTHNRFLFANAVNGIGHYGNCVGVPTVGGEVFFDECYSGNPLVNAMAVGILYEGEEMPSAARGVGNPVLYVGSATGKDGMGGAAFASKELDENSNEDRPAVQVGDPFAEKILIEACLEAFATGCIVAAQDMGAAGLTSSSCEMAAKGNVGMIMDLDKVPAREPDMQPHEYLLSESQERMLMVLEKGREQPVLDVFAKWRIPAVIVGEITENENIQIFHQGEKVVDLPAKLLADLAPSYNRGMNPIEPETAKNRRLVDVKAALPDIQLSETAEWLHRLFASPNIARPTGVINQYDRHVQNNTLLASENLGAGVIRIRQKDGAFSGKALAMTVDCNARYVFLEPYRGSMFAVSQACRNLVCTGALPLAVSDNLNFGNPEKPDIYYQLFYAVQGIKDACEVFETPVISGNVSLYNEHSGEPIYPTPTIAMIGLIEDDRQVMTPALREAGLKLALLGRFKPQLGGSEYQKLRSGKVEGPPPEVDLNHEKRAMDLVLSLIEHQHIQAVQDVSIGGLLPTLLEMTFEHEVGLELKISDLAPELRLEERLFGETGGTYIVAYRPDQEEALKARCGEMMDWMPLGHTVDGFTLILDQQQPAIPLAPLKTLWSQTLAIL
ncbi:phosphoribosylformylglycinamidine synthase subunit PurL [Vampirovibrio sp.]|uniref:phosphoribosylformylglycinamidine synthase subunit PurL n=1 Tax=Vampirovibrio sp. TaxID=2717857 RepID=UPI003593827F